MTILADAVGSLRNYVRISTVLVQLLLPAVPALLILPQLPISEAGLVSDTKCAIQVCLANG